MKESHIQRCLQLSLFSQQTSKIIIDGSRLTKKPQGQMKLAKTILLNSNTFSHIEVRFITYCDPLLRVDHQII